MNSTRPKPWETNNTASDNNISTLTTNSNPNSTYDRIDNSELDDPTKKMSTTVSTTTTTNPNNTAVAGVGGNTNMNRDHSESPPVPPPLSDDIINSNFSNNNNNNSNMYGNSLYGNNHYGSTLNSGMYGNSVYGNSLYGNNMYNNNMGMNMGYGMGMNMGYGMNNVYGNNGLFNRYGTNSSATGTNNENGTGSITESTLATFQLLENLINVINCFTQMLESSYMATYNSFFTLMTFAEEINRFKEFLGSTMGIFSIFKLLKKLKLIKSNKITNGGSNTEKIMGNELIKEFKDYTNQTNKTKRQKLSWKPIIIFLLGVFGFPYVLNKIIKRMYSKQQERIMQIRNQQQNTNNNNNNINLNDLEFARAIYDFIPENPKIEIKINKGELMAILSKKDIMGNDSQWWRVRTKKGEMGYIPSNYIEIIKKKQQDS